ncbi:MAG: exo-alpha-sialidase [Candidatus Eisenbacteria bacterium]
MAVFHHLTSSSPWGLPVVLILLCAGPAPADSPQIRINSDTTTELQNEQQICVNPTDPANFVACWRDFRLGYRQVGIGYSLDGGYSWTDFLLNGPLPWDSDPVLIVGPDGTFYFAVLNYDPAGGSRLIVHRSTTKGVTWEGPFTAVTSTGSDFEDKEWITIDRTGGARDGTLYLTWSRFGAARIMCVSSTDRGQIWSYAVQVSDGNSCQWPVPAVLGNGDLLIAWNGYTGNTISYDISSDGGATWGADRVMTYTVAAPGEAINGDILIFPYPCLAVDESDGPRDGWVYCLYADRLSTYGLDIWCRRSLDNGVTWSNSVRVNDDPLGPRRDQFHPWLVCDEQGILTAIWYDRRDDPANYRWHIYMSRSLDGGVTWEPNVRVTTVASSPADALALAAPETAGGAQSKAPDLRGSQSRSLGNPREEAPGISIAPLEFLRAGLIGEYSGVAVRDGRIHPIWTDTRNGNQDTYTSILYAPAGIDARPGPTGLLSLRAFPSPGAGETLFVLQAARPIEDARVEILDPSGRIVRRIPLGTLNSGETRIPWDGLNGTGAVQPAGIYLAVARDPSAAILARCRSVLLR